MEPNRTSHSNNQSVRTTRKLATALLIAVMMTLVPSGVADASWRCSIPGYGIGNPQICSNYRDRSNTQLLSIYRRIHPSIDAAGMQAQWVTPRMRTEMLRGLDSAGTAIKVTTAYRTFPGPVGAGGRVLFVSLGATAGRLLVAEIDLRRQGPRGAIAVVSTRTTAQLLVACGHSRGRDSNMCLR